MIRIGSNIASLQAQRRLAEGGNELGKTLERLSSGMRINRASDDAAGLAISSTLNADTRIYAQALKNAQDGISVLNIADGALSGLSNVITRLQELATQSANGVYSDTQRSALNSEAQALRNEYNRIISEVEFNGVNLFDPATGELNLQIGGDGSANSILGFDLGKSLVRYIGLGTFQNQYQCASYDSGGNILADIDGDGDTDLLANQFAGAGATFVYLSNGDGSFSAGVSYQGNTIRGIYTADFNNDGALDILGITDQGAGATSVVLGNGNGTFKAPTIIGTAEDAYEAAIGDLNGDGLLDIMVKGNSPTDNLRVFLGTGGGSFSAGVSYHLAGGYGVALGDFNSDGALDVVSGNGIGQSYLTLGNGNGTFKAQTTIIGMETGHESKALDLNGDGHLDIISSSSGGVRVSLGNGNGTFKASNIVTAPGGNIYTAYGDINDDGMIDLLLTDTVSGSFRAFLGRGDGTFTSAGGTVNLGFHAALGMGDINGDEVPDAVASNNSGANGVYFLIQNTTPTVTLKSFSLATRTESLQALTQFTTAMNRISKERGNIGAVQSRLEVAMSNIASMRENFSAAYSRIVDADIAAESSNLVRLKVLQQAATAVLAQANLAPSLALKLLT